MVRLSFRDEAARNRRSSLLLAALVSAIVVALIYVFVSLLAPGLLLVALPLSVILVVLYAYGSYAYGDGVILAATGAVPAEGREYQHLRDTVEGLSIAAGIPAPRIYVVESGEMNAFATGRDPEHASVAVTTGLVRELNRQELEGVVAHEVSHIRGRDILFMTLVAVLVGLAAILSHLLLRAFRNGGAGRREEGGRRGGAGAVLLLIGLALAVFAPVVTRLVQFAISRRREFFADASAAELTRYPEGLASALEKIVKRNRGAMDVSEAVSHLFIVDPTRSPLDELYATHPPMEERIRRLRAM